MRLNHNRRFDLRMNLAILSLGLMVEAPLGITPGIVEVVDHSTDQISLSVRDDVVLDKYLPLNIKKGQSTTRRPVLVGMPKSETSVVTTVVISEAAVFDKEVKAETASEMTPIPDKAQVVVAEELVSEVAPPPPTPPPTPAIKVSVVAPEELEGIFATHAEAFGVDVELLKSIAKCESRFNPNAQGGIYGGLFQFAPATWISTRKTMGLDENPDLRYDANEAVMTAAFKIASGGINAWKGCLR